MKKKSRRLKGRASSGSKKGTRSSADPRISTCLTPADLRWNCPDDFLPESFGDLEPGTGTVGQERALQALRLGLSLRARGYNVYAAGLTGTGRTSTVRHVLEKLSPGICPILKDYAYVHNFSDPNQPRLITLKAGEGRRFAREMESLVKLLRAEIHTLFEDESFKTEAERIRGFYNDIQAKLMDTFEKKLKERNFVLVKVKAGMMLVPQIAAMIDGEPVSVDALGVLVQQGKITAEEAARITGEHDAFKEEMEGLADRLNELTAEMMEKIRELERSAVGKLLDAHVGKIRQGFPGGAIDAFLEQVREDVLQHIQSFKASEPQGGESPLQALVKGVGRGDDFKRYAVNVVLDNTEKSECPVIFEDVPTWANIVGTIKVDISRSGTLETDHTAIGGGSLLRADGGFLVMKALDMFLSPGSWQVLKRVLKTGRLEISLPESPLFPGRVTLKPEPIEVDVKVILIGEPRIYDLLYLNDEEFRGTFKVKAEFDSEMPLRPETVRHYVSVLSRLCKAEDLLSFSRDGMREIVEQGVRRAGDKGKISTRFSDIGDVVREATWWAREDGAKEVSGEHVRQAVRGRQARHDLIEEKIREMIETGRISIEIEGEQVGQVNGLSVLDTGMYSFGKPTRITAAVSMGKGGLINIEREVGLSGRFYDKGVYIISGFLRDRYAKEFPLSLSASLTFEQSYSGVDGDSASSTEVYALLSALSGIPLQQSIAVTGSVDQRGNVQAVGGLDQKIEGYFNICRLKGLTGEQGVIIPKSNVRDLMIRNEVVDAVKEGRFRIWAIDHVDQGIEILTGRPAGRRGIRGRYPADSVNGSVELKLREFARTLSRYE